MTTSTVQSIINNFISKGHTAEMSQLIVKHFIGYNSKRVKQYLDFVGSKTMKKGTK
jgi:hypothetical protein